MNARDEVDLGALARSMAGDADATDPWLRTTDPAAVGRLADGLASRLAEHDVAAVLAWDLPDEAVFAHALAAALGVGVLRADLDLGLWSVDGTWPAEGSGIVIAATGWSGHRAAEPLVALARESGQVPVALVSALTDPTGKSDGLAATLGCPVVVADRS